MKSKLLLVWTVLTLSIPLLVFSQSRQISGRVLNPNGDAVPRATILLKGTTTGTAADENGNFSINVSGSNPVLVISSVGFQTRELRVGNSNNLSVELTGGTALTEVSVTTALGIKRPKRSLGYSAQEISGDALLQTKQNNIVNALRGQVAGVQINSGGGAPGQGSHIVIRGVKSLSPGKNNQPLFVVDGIIIDNSTPQGEFAPGSGSRGSTLRGMSNKAADINPDDVESVSVLRGGAATALYGQAGSNGVVLITTKSAKAGKLKVGFTTTYGIDEVNKFPEVQSLYTQGSLGVYDPTTIFGNWGPTVEASRVIDPTNNPSLFHNYAQGYQKGNQFRSTITLSGGNENALLNASLSYFDQEGVMPFSDYRNISARLGGQFKAGTKFKFSPSVTFINSGGYRVNAERFNEQLSYWAPRVDVKNYITPEGTMVGYGQNNPIFGNYSNRFKDNVNRIIGNISTTYSPFKWLDLDYKGGVDHYSDFRRHTGLGPKGIVGERTYSDNGLGFVDEYRIGNTILSSNLVGTFKKNWGPKFNTTLRVGNDVRAIKFGRVNASGTELDVPGLLTLNNTKTRTNSQEESNYRIVSAFGSLSLSYNNFLFLDLTGRNDWSSTLPAGNNSYFYPSASLSYIFSDHVKDVSWFSYGKLRASWAEIGKDTDPYETNAYYKSVILGLTSQVMWTRDDKKGDNALKPERTSTLEFGTELRFLNNRVGLDFTWYKLNSRDMIIPVKVSPAAGFTEIVLNAGEIENKGIELVLNATPVRTRNFSWDATLNFSKNKNMVVAIREGLTEIVLDSWFGYVGSSATMKYVPGYPVGNIYGTSFLRYYGTKTDDKMTIDNSLPFVILSDPLNLQSNRGFPIVDPTQRVLGNSQPDWIGGLLNTFRYKNLSLSFLFETQQGHDRYNQLGNYQAAFGTALYTLDRNTSKVFPGVLANGTPNTQLVYMGQAKGPDGRDYGQGYYRNIHRAVTESFVEDASWVRLRNLSLSYKIPTSILKTNFIKDATVTFTGNNLLLWTDFSGFDPDASSFHSGSNTDAFAGFAYPAVRSYLFSINVNF